MNSSVLLNMNMTLKNLPFHFWSLVGMLEIPALEMKIKGSAQTLNLEYLIHIQKVSCKHFPVKYRLCKYEGHSREESH